MSCCACICIYILTKETPFKEDMQYSATWRNVMEMRIKCLAHVHVAVSPSDQGSNVDLQQANTWHHPLLRLHSLKRLTCICRDFGD